ncbi:MAG: glycosyltransferase family 2 protein [Christensenellales bacterium]|jgi:glycosyltransferase involved in cell wall biosynthesis
MKISVAMAAYNGSAYIREQIDSILSQLSGEDELVVSDDGSTDGTRELLEQWCASEARLRVLSGPRQGLQQNFAHALDACTGDILFLSDQDDRWAPGKVERVAAIFQARPEVMAVLHDAALVDGQMHPLGGNMFALRDSRPGFWKNLWKNSYMGSCMAFRRELLQVALPIPEGLPMHDQWLGMLAEQVGEVALLPEPLLLYRRHAATVTVDKHGSLATMVRNRARLLAALTARRGAVRAYRRRRARA